MLLSMHLFPLSLYVSSSSASIHWIWNTWFSMSLWIRYHRSSDTPAIFIALMTQLLILAFRIESSISVIVVLASAAIFVMSLICFYTSIIASSPFSILWYVFTQSFLLSFIILALSILLSFLVMYGFGELGVVTLLLLLLLIWDICVLKFKQMVWTVQSGILPSSFINFDSKFLSNSLQLLLFHEAILFLQFIGHAHSHNLSNVPDIEFSVPSFNAFWFPPLHTLLPHW